MTERRNEFREVVNSSQAFFDICLSLKSDDELRVFNEEFNKTGRERKGTIYLTDMRTITPTHENYPKFQKRFPEALNSKYFVVIDDY